MTNSTHKRRHESTLVRLAAALVLLAVIPSALIGYSIYAVDRDRHLEQTATLRTQGASWATGR